MKIKTDEKMKELALQRLSEEINQKDGIFVTDLLYCLRQAYYRKTNPVKPTVKTLSFFLDGNRRHEALQKLLGEPEEVSVEKHGIRGRIDIIHDGAPVEFKTTRSNNHLPEHYFKQLSYYAVMVGADHGYLIIQRLFGGDNPFEFYRVEWSPEELRAIEGDMVARAAILEKALSDGNPEILPKASEEMKWKCISCEYKDICGGENSE